MVWSLKSSNELSLTLVFNSATPQHNAGPFVHCENRLFICGRCCSLASYMGRHCECACPSKNPSNIYLICRLVRSTCKSSNLPKASSNRRPFIRQFKEMACTRLYISLYPIKKSIITVNMDICIFKFIGRIYLFSDGIMNTSSFFYVYINLGFPPKKGAIEIHLSKRPWLNHTSVVDSTFSMLVIIYATYLSSMTILSTIKSLVDM